LVRLAELSLLPTGISPQVSIADAFDVPAAELAATIGDTRVLVVLDGCEQVVESCAEVVADLLGRCPGARFLATSRTALRVPGEVTFRIGPLATPAPEADNRRALRTDAVRLFVERAQEVAPGFAPRGDDVAVIAEITRRCDGLPLAVGRTARRVGDRSLVSLRDDLADPVLTAAVRRSYDLLTAAEQAALRRLSVLPGGFDLDGASAVCVGAGIAPGDVVALVCSLEAKSLIGTATGDEDTPRFHQSRCVRTYALERLAEAGEVAQTQERTVAWLCRRAAALTRTLLFGEARPAALWAEHDNLVAALDFPAASDDDRHVLLTVALARVLWQRQQATAIRQVLTAVRDRVGRSRWLGEALILSALAASAQADHDDALLFAVAALRTAQVTDRPFGRARALQALGFVRACRSEFAAAVAAYLECLGLVLADGDALDVAECQHCLAWTLLMAGEPARAKPFLDDALAVATSTAPRRSRVAVANTVGTLRLAQGDEDSARKAFAEVLRLAPHGDHLTSYALDGLAILAGRRGDARRAVALATAACRIRKRCGVTVSAAWQGQVDRATAEATRRLGADQADAAVDAGRRLRGDRLLAYALRDRPGDDARSPSQGVLTHRELQIACLVADGMTDREIAEQLGLAVRTVRSHLTSMHQKLDLRSRIQLAVWTTRLAGSAGDR
jgi:predicted ATPase/DNA-binding CsgD family transcriptional regulator